MNGSERQQNLKRAYEANGDQWWDELDPILRHAEIAEAYVRFATVTAETGVLSPKIRDLILLAVNASTTTLHVPSINWYIREALRHGATVEEIVEIFELVSVLGIHSAHTGLPILRDVLKECGLLETEDLNDRQKDIKEKYIAGRGMWGDAMEAMLLLDPGLIEAYLAFSRVPWDRGALPAATKELVYIAIDASITHMYNAGTGSHIRRALEAGVSKEEIAGVLTLVSTLGVHSLTSGLRLLHEIADQSV
jgi:alkylhydroperoxidase/carboxymuconolactone decarboxylase family protein YurZ